MLGGIVLRERRCWGDCLERERCWGRDCLEREMVFSLIHGISDCSPTIQSFVNGGGVRLIGKLWKKEGLGWLLSMSLLRD